MGSPLENPPLKNAKGVYATKQPWWSKLDSHGFRCYNVHPGPSKEQLLLCCEDQSQIQRPEKHQCGTRFRWELQQGVVRLEEENWLERNLSKSQLICWARVHWLLYLLGASGLLGFFVLLNSVCSEGWMNQKIAPQLVWNVDPLSRSVVSHHVDVGRDCFTPFVNHCFTQSEFMSISQASMPLFFALMLS